MTVYKQAHLHFKKVDTALYRAAKVVEKHLPKKHTKKNNQKLFESLCESIVSQQLSVKAADTIYGRLQVACKGVVSPTSLLALSPKKMRSCGLSGTKTKSLKAIARAVREGLTLSELSRMSEEEATNSLTRLYGVGPWTAHMFLMFGCGHDDIFAPGDLGLVRAIEMLYRKKNPSARTLSALSKKWQPYRSHACRVLWKYRDTKVR